MSRNWILANPLSSSSDLILRSAKLFIWNFHPPEVVSRWRWLSEWALLYLAFCTIMAISRQKESRSQLRLCPSLIEWQHHRQHCIFQAFEPFEHYIYTTVMTRIRLGQYDYISPDMSFQLQPDRMSHRDRTYDVEATQHQFSGSYVSVGYILLSVTLICCHLWILSDFTCIMGYILIYPCCSIYPADTTRWHKDV